MNCEIDKYLKGDIYEIISKIDKRTGTPDKIITDITGIKFYDSVSDIDTYGRRTVGWKKPAHHTVSYNWKGYTRGTANGEPFEIKIDDGYGHCEIYDLVGIKNCQRKELFEQIRHLKPNKIT